MVPLLGQYQSSEFHDEYFVKSVAYSTENSREMYVIFADLWCTSFLYSHM
jgi:hypothetical protein